MAIKEQDIFSRVEALGDHFRQNIHNRYLRNTLLHMPLEKGIWESIDKMTELSDYTRLQGYRYDEIYEQIYAMAVFISKVRETILPNLKSLGASVGGIADRDKILKDMAFSNLGSNLGILADKVNELFLKIIELDRIENRGRKTEYEKMPELADIGRLLVS